MSDKSPGLAILMMGKKQHDEPDGDEPMSDEELNSALKDALDAHDEAEGSGDPDRRIEARHALHRLHTEKMRREEES